MTDHTPSTAAEAVGVSLVDGDPVVRHERQLMLLSRQFDVRAYETCAALLADPRSRDFACIVVDIEMKTCTGPELLRSMRASGWRGKAVLLGSDTTDSATVREAEAHGDQILERSLSDQALVAAISASVDRGWSSWTAAG